MYVTCVLDGLSCGQWATALTSAATVTHDFPSQYGTAVDFLLTDATVELPCEQRSKGFLPKPATPAEYRA
jgi:hypothetical protein